MNITHDLIWQVDEVIPKEICEYTIDSYKKQEEEKATIAEGNKNSIFNDHVRDTKINWLDQMSPIGCTLQVYINAANKNAGWDFNLYHMEKIQLSKYDKNGFYDWHIDTCPPNANDIQRKISAVALLSDPEDFKGGKLQIKDLSDYGYDEDMITLKQGSIICFPSYLEHKVTRVTEGVRYTAVTWMTGHKWV